MGVLKRYATKSTKPDSFKSANVYIVIDSDGAPITVRTNLGQVYQEAFVNPDAIGVEFWDASKGVLLGVTMKDGRTLTAKMIEAEKEASNPPHVLTTVVGSTESNVYRKKAVDPNSVKSSKAWMNGPK